MKNCFRAPRLFMPRGGFERWAVPAADSHPADRDFWERVARNAGSAPSSLHCILPDACREEESADAAARYMADALAEETLERIGRGFIFTERKLKNGRIRTGIVAALDLEAFSYARGEITPVRATEGCTSRAEELVGYRGKSILEFPHTMLFYRDKKNKLAESLKEADLDRIYDVTLMEDGGRMRGSFIAEEDAYGVAAEMASRGEPCFAVADGHEEIIAAKMYWEKIKPSLRGLELKNHPARYALAECVNLYDPAVELLPVHRILTDTDTDAFLDYFARNIKCKREGNILYAEAAGAEGTERVDDIIAAYRKANGGRVRYTEDRGEISRLREGAAVVLKPMDKEDLFYDLKGGRLMPRHTFSIGEENKRYSLEGREISYD